MDKFLKNAEENINKAGENVKQSASNTKQSVINRKEKFQKSAQETNDEWGKGYDDLVNDNFIKNKFNDLKNGISNTLLPTEEDKFRNELLLLSTNTDFQEYFAQSVSNRLVFEFYKILPELGKSSSNYTELLSQTGFKEKNNSKDISDFFSGLITSATTTATGLCVNDPDKYNLLADEKITNFLNNAMVIYAEVIRKDFQKLADVITNCKKLEEQKKLKKEAEIQKEAKLQIEELQNYFKKPFMSGGINPNDKIDKTNKIDLISGNIIKYKPLFGDIVFYTVQTIPLLNTITLTNCGSKIKIIVDKEVNEILDSGKCTFVSNQENPANSCEQMQKKANAKDLTDYFYNEILLKILMNQKAMFSNCLRARLSPILDKVLEKLDIFAGTKGTTIKLDNSDKKYTINTDIEKLIEKLVCKIGIIPITELEPFKNVVKSSFKRKIDQLKNLLKRVEEKKEKEVEPIKKSNLETKMKEIQTKVGEIENYIKSETTKKKEKKAEAKKLAKDKAVQDAKEEADRIAKEETEKAEAKEKAEKDAKEKAEADRIAKEAEAETERLAKEKAEADRIAKEAEAETERLAKEKDETERLAKEKAEQEKAEAEILLKEKTKQIQNYYNTGCTKFDKLYDDYQMLIRSLKELNKPPSRNESYVKNILNQTVKNLDDIKKISLNGDGPTCPAFLDQKNPWFSNEFKQITKYIEEYNTKNSNNQVSMPNNPYVSSGGKTKKKIYKHKRFFTRKSSSRVSRKTRRHKRTSR